MRKSCRLTLALIFSSTALLAQRPPGEGGPPGGRDGGEGRMPHPPLVSALDANGDGTIDAAEIANASVALRKLDRNGDGKLTPDEYRPQRPGGDGERRPGGEGPPPRRPS
ncbi:MAG: EF-hand domain-containing protein [Thermoanaerobaculia bacterium]